ncbi:MAG: PilZ domain-containing protein [Gammaproteobacteria bacterium]
MVVSNTELIRNRYRIVSLLQRAQAARAIASLRRPHEQFIYNSAILAVHPDEGHFIIDAPASSQIPLQARVGDWLKFRIKLQGLLLGFDAVIEALIANTGDPHSYRLRLPMQVDYEQRRAAFRANIGQQFHARFSARLSEQQQLSGRLTDLSLSGVCVEIDIRTHPAVKHDTHISQCVLQLENSLIKINSARVLTIQAAEQSLDIFRLGIAFDELSAAERRDLQRWVMKFDRENRKSALPG